MRSKQIEELKRSLRISEIQHETLVGILLGDAHLERRPGGNIFRVKVEQSAAHADYVNHLYELFKEWVRTPPRERIVQSSTGSKSTNLTFQTYSHAAFRFYAQQFYKGRHKSIPKLLHRWLTPRALAYWYMDDGSLKSKDSKTVILNTQGYDAQSIAIAIRTLETKFKLICKERHQKDGVQIYISGRSYEQFQALVEPFILPSFLYKVPRRRKT